MARQWVQQYEDNGRLINKYVEDDGSESFEDAGPVQQPEPAPQPAPPPAAAYIPPYDPGPSPTALWGMAQRGQPDPNPPQHSNPIQVAPNGAVTYDNTGTTVPASAAPWNPSPAAPQTGAPPAAPDPYAKLLADNAARQAAGEAAQLAYQNAILQGQRDDRALAAANAAWQHTFSERQQAFTEQQAQNTTGLGVLGLQAQLRGPSNWAQYMRTLSNTPEGLKSAVNALAGRYGLSSQQTSAPGAQYERQSLQTLVRDLNGTPVAAELNGADLPGGSQWNAANANILLKNPTQAGMLQSVYEDAGRDWNTELANYTSSLPKYGGAQRATVALR